jgi:hypothetical protein
LKKIALSILIFGYTGLFAANLTDANNISKWFLDQGCSVIKLNEKNVMIRCKDGSDYLYKFSESKLANDDGLYKILPNGVMLLIEKR